MTTDLSQYTDEELENMLSEAEDSPEKKPVAFLPKADEVESLISGRKDVLSDFVNDIKKPASKDDLLSLLIPGNAAFQGGKKALQGIGGVFQRGEAALANVGLDLQAGNIGKSTVDSFVQGVTGERKGELGDLVRTTGFGGSSNEALASITGFMGLVGATNLATKGRLLDSAKNMRAALRSQKNSDKVRQADFLVDRAKEYRKGVGEIKNAIGQEIDDLYKGISSDPGIGRNPISVEQRLITKEMMGNLANEIKRYNRTTGKKVGVTLNPETGANNVRQVWELRKLIDRSKTNLPDNKRFLLDSRSELNDFIARNTGSISKTKQLLRLNKKFSEISKAEEVINSFTLKKTSKLPTARIGNIRERSLAGENQFLRDFNKKYFSKGESILREVDKFTKAEKIRKGIAQVAARGVEGLVIGGSIGGILRGRQ